MFWGICCLRALIISFIFNQETTFDFVFWNCNGLRSNRTELEKFLSSYRPHVVGLCETFLTSKVKCSFLGYHPMIRQDRPDNSGRGGLAFLVRKDIVFSNFSLISYYNGNLEFLSLKIKFRWGWAPFCIFYNPHKNIILKEFQHFFEQLPQHSLISGDFNSHHPLWGTVGHSRFSNESGISLFNFITQSSHHTLLTPKGLRTFFDRRHGTYSTLDLTLGSGNFSQIGFIQSGPGIGGDHFPIIHKFNFSPTTETMQNQRKWNLRNINWGTYMKTINETINKVENKKFPDNVKAFSDCLVNAGRKVANLGQTTKKAKFNRAFWDEECSRAIAIRRNYQRKFAKFPNIENKINHNRQVAIVKRTIKKKKADAWHKFTKSLSFSTPSTKIWQFLRNLQGKSLQTNLPIEKNGDPLSTNKEKAQHLAEYYSRIFNTPHDHEDLLPNITAIKAISTKNAYNNDLTMYELQSAIKKLKSNSATGIDLIHNQFIINLPPSSHNHLLKIFNQSWNNGIIPSTWKEANILPFLKANKSSSLEASYRPISLLSCLGKLIERIICNRLTWFLENKNLQPCNQFGFRKGRSTLDPLIILEQNIQITLRTKKVMIAVFFDVEKAFDRASRTAILSKLINIGIVGKMFSWINEFLSSRSFKVTVGSACSEVFPSTSGVPQGSILSPTLYTILLNDFKINKNVSDLYYANDTTFYVIDSDLSTAADKMQAALITFEAWCNCWGIKINSDKSAFMCFTRKRINRIPILKYEDRSIKLHSRHKFLGLTLDAPLLTWKPHINLLKEKCIKRLNIMKCLAGTSWGASREILLKFYTVYIQSLINYGKVIYSSASPSLKHSLEIIRNTGLRISTGARRTTPIKSLEVETGIMPFRLQNHIICTKHYAKCSQLSLNNPILNNFRNSKNLLNHINWITFPHKKPFFLRAQIDSFTSLSTPIPKINPTPTVSPVPPWSSLESAISKDFPGWNRKSPNSQTSTLFNSLIENSFKDYSHIYTDGSHFSDPPATGAAILWFQLGSSRSYRLNHMHSALSAELFAILKALEWIESNIKNIKKPIVIFTDSLVSLHLISIHNPSSYRSIVYTIKEKIIHILSFIIIHFQWIPGHSGIWGNDLVDILAKESCTFTDINPYPVCINDLNTVYKSAAKSIWSAEWDLVSQQTWLGVSRPKINKYSWFSHPNRAVDVALTRIRLGHTGLASSLHKFGFVESPLCRYCFQIEDIEHFVIHCPKNERARVKMKNSINLLGLRNLTMENLLLNGESRNMSESIKNKITRIFASFILSTGRITEI